MGGQRSYTNEMAYMVLLSKCSRAGQIATILLVSASKLALLTQVLLSKCSPILPMLVRYRGLQVGCHKFCDENSRMRGISIQNSHQK